MADVQVALSTRVLAQIVEAVGHCELFLRQSDTARAELVEYCLPRPGVTSTGLVEDLAWHHLYLRTRLAETRAAHTQETGTSDV